MIQIGDVYNHRQHHKYYITLPEYRVTKVSSDGKVIHLMGNTNWEFPVSDAELDRDYIKVELNKEG